jgi:hypothetical protein
MALTENEKEANRISDAVVNLAKKEVRSGTPGNVIAVGLCLGMLGALAESDVPELLYALRNVIFDITGKRVLKLTDGANVEKISRN